MKVYLDNVIVSGIEKRDLASPAEMQALDELTSGKYADTCEWVTSRWSLREIERTSDKTLRERLKKAFHTYSVIEDDHKVLGFHNQSDQYGGFINSPLVTDIVDEKVFSELRALGLNKADPYHLMVALANGCDRFLTTDPDFLNIRSQIELSFQSIKIVVPSALLAELSSSIA